MHRIFFTPRKLHVLFYLLTWIIAYAILYGRDYPALHNFISSFGIYGMFIAGLLYAYGFTASPAISLILIMSSEQDAITIFVAALGATIGNLLFYSLLKHKFSEQLRKVSHEKFIKRLERLIPKRLHEQVMQLIAGIIIASPLPSELAVSLLALSRKIPFRKLAVLSFIMNSLGVGLIFLLGRIYG